MVRVAVWLVPLELAVIVTLVLAETATVVTVKVALVAPEAMVTEAGVLADAELSLRVITRPLEGAAEPMWTVPVEELPPTTDVGLMVREVTVGGLIVRTAVWEVLFAVAVMVAFVCAATATVVIVKLAVVAPAATVTVAGTVAELELLESDTA